MHRMALCSLVFLVGAAACGKSEPPAKSPEPTATSESTPAATGMSTETTQGNPSLAASTTGTGTSTTANPTSPGTSGVGASGTGSSTTAPSPTTPLTDDQILYILHVTNMGEMDQARIAEKQAKNARVKRFASMMLKEHGEADGKGNEVAKKTHASLTPSEPSNQIETEAKQLSSQIATQKGKDFDRAYIDAQVKQHRTVLDLIERELLPAARSTEVKELLQTIRPKIESHLQEAQQIQKGLVGP
jgi:putative membrane protein